MQTAELTKQDILWERLKHIQTFSSHTVREIGFDLFYDRADRTVRGWAEDTRINGCCEYGTNSYLKHRPAMRERGGVIGYYAVAKLKGGAYAFRYMSKEDALEHGRQHSKTYDQKTKQFNDKSPWTTEEDAMCMKTVLLQLSKVLPISMEIQKAISIDETSRDYRQGIEDAVALPSTTTWDEQSVIEASAVTGEASKVVSTSTNDKSVITEEQRKRLLAIASSKGHAKEHVNAFILEKYTIDSTTKIPAFLYEEICANYSKMPEVPAGF